MFYDVKKDDKGSKVVLANISEKPYKHNFKEIYDFSLKENFYNFTDFEIYHYPNIMKQILEELLSFKINNESTSLLTFKNLKKVFYDEQALTIKDEMQFSSLLNICNSFSNKNTKDPAEILKAAKFLMEKIK